MDEEQLETRLQRIEMKLDALLRVAGIEERITITAPDPGGATITGTVEQMDGMASENARRQRGDLPQFRHGEIIDI